MAEQEFDVVDLDPVDHPVEGETAPDFTRPLVTTELWEDASLSDLYAEGPVLLLFHPMDGAFPSTYLWNEVRDRGWEDQDKVQVVGISISTPYAHKRLIESREIESRLFSDPSNGVAEQYNIVHDLDGMAGIEEPRPAAFLIDRAEQSSSGNRAQPGDSEGSKDPRAAGEAGDITERSSVSSQTQSGDSEGSKDPRAAGEAGDSEEQRSSSSRNGKRSGDSEGVIQYAWVAEEWPAFPEYDEIQAAIEEL